MQKRLGLTIIAALTLVLLLVSPVLANGPTLLAGVDINTSGGVVTDTNLVPGTSTKFISSFNAEQPGNWGGEYGDGAVTAFPGDSDLAGYVTFTWDSGFARRIELRVLDGIADDSFDVYVKNPGGNWALVYSYTSDPDTSEYWVVHHIYSFPAGKGQGESLQMKIVPTNLGWSGFGTWGQLGVDWIKVWDH